MTIIQARTSVDIAIETGTRREVQARRLLFHAAVWLRRRGGLRLAHLVISSVWTRPIRCPTALSWFRAVTRSVSFSRRPLNRTPILLPVYRPLLSSVRFEAFSHPIVRETTIQLTSYRLLSLIRKPSLDGKFTWTFDVTTSSIPRARDNTLQSTISAVRRPQVETAAPSAAQPPPPTRPTPNLGRRSSDPGDVFRIIRTYLVPVSRERYSESRPGGFVRRISR